MASIAGQRLLLLPVFHQGVLGRGLFWQGNVMALVFTCSVQTSPWTLSDGQSMLICSNHQTIPMAEAAPKIDTKIYQDRYVKILYIKQDIIHQARYTVIYRCIRMIMTHELLKQVIPSTPAKASPSKKSSCRAAAAPQPVASCRHCDIGILDFLKGPSQKNRKYSL